MVGYIEKLQARTGALHEFCRAPADVFYWAVFENLVIIQCQHVFLLAGDQSGRVETQKYGVFLDLFAGSIDEQFLDPAFDLRVQLHDPPLVVADSSDGAHRVAQ